MRGKGLAFSLLIGVLAIGCSAGTVAAGANPDIGTTQANMVSQSVATSTQWSAQAQNGLALISPPDTGMKLVSQVDTEMTLVAPIDTVSGVSPDINQSETTVTATIKFRNYIALYGKGNLDLVRGLDLAIVQPETFSDGEIKTLKSSGTRVAVYLNIGEVEESRPWWNDVQKDWLLKKNDNKGTWFVDPTKQNWADVLLNKVIPQYVQRGFDGLFLDLGDTTTYFPETTEGMVNLIKAIRTKFPKLVLLQKNGFDLLSRTGKSIDAVVWDSFASGVQISTGRYERRLISPAVAQQYKAQADTNGYQILALGYALKYDYDAIDYIYNEANKYGFLPYVADNKLADIYTYFTRENFVSSLVFGLDDTLTTAPNYVYDNSKDRSGWSQVDALDGHDFRSANSPDAGLILTLAQLKDSIFGIVYYDGSSADSSVNLNVFNGTAWMPAGTIVCGGSNRWKYGEFRLPMPYLYDVDKKKPGIQVQLSVRSGRITYLGSSIDLYGKAYTKGGKLNVEVYNVSAQNLKNVKINIKSTATNRVISEQMVNIDANSLAKLTFEQKPEEIKVTIDPDNAIREWNKANNTFVYKPE